MSKISEASQRRGVEIGSMEFSLTMPVRLAASPHSEKPSPTASGLSRIVPQSLTVAGRLIGAVLDMAGGPEMGDSRPSR
jgi:hypothetical protein